jgi:nucleoid-associated protein YgaU
MLVENAEIVTIAENLEPATESIDEVLEPDDTEIENAVVAAQEKDTETISLPLDKVTVMEPEIETVESKNEPKNSATADDTSLKLATTTRSDFKRIEFNKDSKKTFPVTKIIQRGDEVFDLCTQVYGFCNAQVLALVKSNNPHIRNINVIYPNLKIIFPDLGQIKQIDRK